MRATASLAGAVLLGAPLLSVGGESRPGSGPALSERRFTPTSGAELEAWLGELRAELARPGALLLPAADADLADSPLAAGLAEARGPWFADAVGRLAVRETDPFLKAVLLLALYREAFEPAPNPALARYLPALLEHFGADANDLFGVGSELAVLAFRSAGGLGIDYPALVAGPLLAADGFGLLSMGYLLMGDFEGGAGPLGFALLHHPHRDGRFGAIEGLRAAILKGNASAEEGVRLFRQALEGELDRRNRVLALEAIAAAGGPRGRALVEGMAADPASPVRIEAAEFLIDELPPVEALAWLGERLAQARDDLDWQRGLYRVAAGVRGPQAPRMLLEIAAAADRPIETRQAALLGLWERRLEPQVQSELLDVYEGPAPAELRAEALRLLVLSAGNPRRWDPRELATSADDPRLADAAFGLAILEPRADTWSWAVEHARSREPEARRTALAEALVGQVADLGDPRGRLAGLLAELAPGEARTRLLNGYREALDAHEPSSVADELRRKIDLHRGAVRRLSGSDRHRFQLAAERFERRLASLQLRVGG
ncbi:MAG: hypothetical protein AAF682_04560 [Planctomycetota bacterium]